MRKLKWLIVPAALVLCAGTAWADPPERGVATPFDADVALVKERPPDVGGGRAVGDLVDLDASMQLGAEYLRKMQADITEDNAGNGSDGVDESPDDPDDGGWDWVTTIFSHSTAASPTNLYGVTGLGLYYAYLEADDSSHFTALTDAAGNMVTDPTIDSAGDLVFLMLYNDLPGVSGTTFADSARTKYIARITTHGSAQAFAVWIRDFRHGEGNDNGIIAWDIGAWARAAAMLDARYPGNGYDTDADNIAEVIYQDSFNDTPGYFDLVRCAGWDPTYGNRDYYWYTLGLTGLIDAFDASGIHTDEIPGLVTRLLDSQYTGGAISYCYGANDDDEDWQSTAYAMMSLGNLDQATYQTQINWMGYWTGATQHTSGGWVYGSGNHYPEVGGECTSGLYFTTNDVTDVIVDDDFTSQADVDAYNTAHGTSYVWGYDAFATIQDGIDGVAGSTVNVAAGTYEEQVVIDKNDLDLIGAGSGDDPATDTIIQSPVSLTYFFGTNYPIVGVHDATGVSIENLRVDGLGRGNGNYRFVGIAFWNGDGDVIDCAVTRICETPHTGAQHGVGIYAYNDDEGPYTVNVTGTTVDDYQKNGMALNGTNLTANVSGCTTTGWGPTAITAQNGIQFGWGAAGTIDGCTVSDHMYTGPDWASTGVLFYECTSVDVTDTRITDNLPAVYCQDTNATFNGISVSNQDANSGDGFYAYNTTGTKTGDPQAPRLDAAPFAEADRAGSGGRTVMTASVSDSSFVGHDKADSWGVSAFASGTDAVNLSLSCSTVKDWDYGVVAYDWDGPVNLTANSNSIVSNVSYGFYTDVTGVQNGENNWWGDAGGPYDPNDGGETTEVPTCTDNPELEKNEDGTGDPVDDTFAAAVDYCPWLDSAPTLTLNPNPGPCYDVDGFVTVDVDMTNMTSTIVGGQFFLTYDKDVLEFVSIEPGEEPFTLEILEVVNDAAGTIDYLVGIQNDGTGTSDDKTMAVITFKGLVDDVCEVVELVKFDLSHDPPTGVSDPFGGKIFPEKVNLSAITIDSTPPTITGCPLDITQANDVSLCSAVVTWTPPTANDNCDGVLTPTGSHTPGDTFPVGMTTVTYNVSDSCGNAATPCSFDVTVNDTEDPTITCPLDVEVNADAGVCYATGVDLGTPMTDDNCGVASVTNDFNTQFPSGQVPAGTHTITWTVTDIHSNTKTCPQIVTVYAFNELVVDVQLQPTFATGDVDRCITFELYLGDALKATVRQVITFTNGVADDAEVLVPCDLYDCIMARDELHTLRRTTDVTIPIGETYYVADFTGVPPAGDWLIGGNFNNDGWVDIFDYGVFIWQYLTDYGSGDTDCDTSYPHADANGDGLVDTVDFTYVSNNFLLGHEAPCNGGGLIGGPRTRISVAELHKLGMSELAAGDLNNDGWLDEADIAAFAQGARPKPAVQTPDDGPSQVDPTSVRPRP